MYVKMLVKICICDLKYVSSKFPTVETTDHTKYMKNAL